MVHASTHLPPAVFMCPERFPDGRALTPLRARAGDYPGAAHGALGPVRLERRPARGQQELPQARGAHAQPRPPPAEGARPCPATPRGRHPATGATRFPSHFRTRRHADQARAPPQNFEFLPRCTRNEIVDAVTSESLCRLAFFQELSQVPPPARPPFVPASSPCFHPPPPPSLPTPFPEKSSLSEP